MPISDKDREALWQVVADVRDASLRSPGDAATDDIVDVVISAGWSPRPKATLAEMISTVEALAALDMRDMRDMLAARAHCAELGIEVTD